jgi:hypothetical protein
MSGFFEGQESIFEGDPKWALLYIERWLKAPMVKEEGTTMERNWARHKAAWSAQF